ncbi:hypothetical protein BDZ94DRAFT_1248125 [Collybia nuda]|uniref:Uncharacterized protein n=1 Tax=Collybia nuda TaxID=64659 RepID=A0A9P5YES8_9AGAR|nr:hypothetical protein BDZ94DRAFT_1248125 [Collybia nuda]
MWQATTSSTICTPSGPSLSGAQYKKPHPTGSLDSEIQINCHIDRDSTNSAYACSTKSVVLQRNRAELCNRVPCQSISPGIISSAHFPKLHLHPVLRQHFNKIVELFKILCIYLLSALYILPPTLSSSKYPFCHTLNNILRIGHNNNHGSLPSG